MKYPKVMNNNKRYEITKAHKWQMVKHEYEQGDDGDGSVNEARLNEKVPSRKALINYGIKQKVGQPKFTWLDHKGTTYLFQFLLY